MGQLPIGLSLEESSSFRPKVFCGVSCFIFKLSKYVFIITCLFRMVYIKIKLVLYEWNIAKLVKKERYYLGLSFLHLSRDKLDTLVHLDDCEVVGTRESVVVPVSAVLFPVK